VSRPPRSDAGMRKGQWRSGAPGLNAQVAGQMLGMVGLGQVGRAVARRAVGFGLRAVACEPFLAPEACAEHHVTGIALDQLLSNADFVCLSLPLVPATRHIIDERRLALMKPSAILINVARGGWWISRRWPAPWPRAGWPRPGWRCSSKSRPIPPTHCCAWKM
jgi:D-3-phosphoglycerate dehydrogenase